MKYSEQSIFLIKKKGHFLADNFNQKTSEVFHDTEAAHCPQPQQTPRCSNATKTLILWHQGWGQQGRSQCGGGTAGQVPVQWVPAVPTKGWTGQIAQQKLELAPTQPREQGPSSDLLQQRAPCLTPTMCCLQLPQPQHHLMPGLLREETLESQGFQTSLNKP